MTRTRETPTLTAAERRLIDDCARAAELEEQAGQYAEAGDIRRAAESQIRADRLHQSVRHGRQHTAGERRCHATV